MRIATFNVQNLRVRRLAGGLRLDGARDDDAPGESGPEAESLDRADRELTARVLLQAGADVVALQEVFDQASLDYFHDTQLAPRGALYPHRVCIEGNDGRSEDVALLSRVPIEEVRSHAALTYAEASAPAPPGHLPHERVFRRDCLAARCGGLWVFVCHFKAAQPGDLGDRAVRRAEARAVRHVIESTAPAGELWATLGDFNAHDRDSESDLEGLMEGFAFDLCSRLSPEERWTYHHPWTGAYSCPDRILAPMGLQRCFTTPVVLRSGLGSSAGAYRGAHLPGVGNIRPHASDHALLWVDLDPTANG